MANSPTRRGKQLPYKAVERYTAGKVTLEQLARQINTTVGKVARLLREAGVDVPPLLDPKPVTELPAEQVELYRQDRTTIAAIARKIGRREETVARLLRDAGVEIRPGRGRGQTPFSDWGKDGWSTRP